jgi:hypothetical protein
MDEQSTALLQLLAQGMRDIAHGDVLSAAEAFAQIELLDSDNGDQADES